MNILLISLPQKTERKKFEVLQVPSLALYSLGSVLKKYGHNISVIDPCEFIYTEGENNVEKACCTMIEEYLEEGYDIVGFSVNTFNWGITKEIVNHTNWNENIIVLGGLHVSFFDEYALRNTKADIVMRGEGEITWCKLTDSIEKGKPLDTIHGITYKKGTKIVRNMDRNYMNVEELEDLPFPDYSLLPVDNPYLEMPVESSRGCQFSCSFCSIPHRHNWRGLCEDMVVTKVKHAEKYMKNIVQRGNVLFVDDCFSMNPERAVNILDSLYKCYGNKMKYFIEARISNIISGKFLDNFQNGIISQMQIGVECGYDDGLKKIKKGFTIKQLYEGLKIIEEKSLTNIANLSFIIGFPWENNELINRTLDTVEYIVNEFGMLCRVNWFMLLPSDLWCVRKKYGIDVDEDIFDNPLWSYDAEIFYEVHPLIDKSCIERIEERIRLIYSQTPKISYNRAFSI